MSAAILVTGASSGIGRRVTERLSSLGRRVFATARNEDDLRSLGALPGVAPIALDVRDPAAITAAVRQVREDGRGLSGLVNNAGIGGIGPIVAWTDEELEEIFAINALGPIRVSRAFLPLLLASKGRIVNIGSQGGSISKKYYGPYTMTKHALEAFTVAFREELQPFGVHVCIVQPGGVVTAIGQNSRHADFGRLSRAPAPFDREAGMLLAAFAPDPHDDTNPRVLSEGEERAVADADAGTATEGEADSQTAAGVPESETNRKPVDPDVVAEIVLAALFDPEPRRRYLVGTRWEGNRVVDALLERLVEANECPALAYSRAELVGRLDRWLGAGEPAS